MNNLYRLPALCALLGVALAASAQTVVINGKAVPMSAVVQNGKLLVDGAALAKALGCTVTWDAKNKKLVITAPKPAASAPLPSTSAAAGTAQMPGEQATFGTLYALDKEDPIYFNLLSAEYAVARVKFGDVTIFPAANEKLLVLHYTLQNPQKYERPVNWATLRFTVVDAGNENHEFVEYVGVEETKKKLELSLKPAQKIAAYTVIKVPAKGVVPKLIVQPLTGGVLRYDLRGKVTPVGAPFNDPTDDSGVSVRPEVPAQPGVAYPLNNFDVQLVKAEYTTKTVREDEEPEEGKRFMVFTFKVKNMTPLETEMNWGCFNLAFRTAAGRNIEWNQWLLLAGVGEEAHFEMKPGQEETVRAYFMLPAADTGKTLRLHENENSRAYLFDVSGVK